MTTQTYDSSFLSQRACALTVIVAVHALAVYALTTGLAGKVFEIIAPPIQVELIQKIRQPEEAPATPQPELDEPRIQIPRPDIRIAIPIETPKAITYVTTAPPTVKHAIPSPVTKPAPPRPRSIIHANVGKNFPNADDFYPPASQRLEEQGAVKVQVCIGPNGQLARPPSVAKTSGFPRLDEAAIKLARLGHYLAGSIDGTPTTECLQLPIRFQMKS